MTVKEVIDELKKLDQNKDIWICYDGYEYFPPIPDDEAGSDYNGEFIYLEDKKVSKGDYIITAG